MPSIRIIRRVIAGALLGSTCATFALAGPVAADYPVIYGEVSVCPGATVTASIPLKARRADFNPPNFANGETLTFSVVGSPLISGGGSGSATLTDNNLTLPEDWTGYPFGPYAPDAAAITISYTAPANLARFHAQRTRSR